jgi:hypothetical protein
MRANRLLLVVPALLVVGGVALVARLAVRAEGPTWNTREPAIMHLSFPSQEEIAAKSVAATAAERAEGMKWIGEFLKPAAMPEGLDGHLLPMKDAIPAAHAAVIGSGYPGSPPGGIRMTSGFIAKWEAQGYVFQVMETRGEVIVGVLDLGTTSARPSEADRTAFVHDTVQRFIRPQPADPFIIAKHLPLATYGLYSPVKQIAGPEGHYALDPKQMSRSSFRDIKFATDGKAVVFEAHKNFTEPVNPATPKFSALAPSAPAGP